MANPENKQIPYESTQKDIRDAIESVATAIGGIAIPSADHVSYDNSVSGLSATDVQDAIDELKSDIPTVNDGTLTIQQNGETKGTFTANQSGNSTVNIETPTTDIQTAVDEFETYNGGILDSLKVALTPIQDLHGFDHPWIGGAGKNKLDDSKKGFGGGNIWFGDAISQASGTSCTLSAGTYTFTVNTADGTTTNMYAVNSDNGTYISGFPAYNANSITFTLSETTNVRIWVYKADYTSTADINTAQIEVGNQPTSYEPYSNICPITGHTQVDVDVSDGQATQEQVTVNLGGTYYSGTLDVVSGKLTDDGKKAVCVLDGTEGFTKSSTYQGSFYRNWNYFNPTGKVNGQIKCSHAKFVTLASGEYAYGKCTSDNSLNLWLGQPEWTITDFQNYLATQYANGTPVTIEYEVNSPTETEIQLSPTMVKALVGENHLSAPLDGQEITESKYKQMFIFDDVIAYIQSL